MNGWIWIVMIALGVVLLVVACCKASGDYDRRTDRKQETTCETCLRWPECNGVDDGCPMKKKPVLHQCPKCGRTPRIGYVCGDYFIVAEDDSCSFCHGFDEMHSSEKIEIEAWNRRVNDG